jgi:hypothetical protein
MEYDGSTSLAEAPFHDAARETFCQELIAGEDLYCAYSTAGFKRPRGNAQRMRHEDEVSKRLEWLGKKIASLDEILIGYRRLEHRRALEHIATADRLELFEEKTITVQVGFDADKKPIRKRFKRIGLRPLKELTADMRALIDGIEISDKGAVKLLMPKRLDARTMLAKLDGLDKPTRGELTGPNNVPLIPEYTDEQRVIALTALLTKTTLRVPA